MTDPSRLLHQRVSPFGQARVYEVGGAVRDRMIGLDSKDLDYVVTGLPAESFSTVFMHDRVDYVGESFGVYKIQLRRLGEVLTPVLDVALPRTERSTGSGHRDFEVQASHEISLLEDLSRRDFTFNAMAFDVQEQELIDPFGGQEHLQQKELVFVGDAFERVQEDPLRILRAFRLMVKLDLRVPLGQTRDAIRHSTRLLQTLPPERIWNELWGMLSYADANPRALARALYWMMHDGVLAEIIPDYAAAIGLDQGTPYHHLDLADHMIESVAYGQEIGAAPATKLALLLHDLGKLTTRTQGEDGKAHYYGHEEVGAWQAYRILEGLRAPTALNLQVGKLIQNHMRLSPRQPLGDKGLRRFLNDLGPLWKDSIDHRTADLLAHAPGLHDVSPLAWRTELLAHAEAVGTEVACLSDHTLALSGTEIMAALNLTPGRAVGEAKAALLQEVIDGLIPNERHALIERLKELHV